MVCSGRKRPHSSNGQCDADAEGSAFVGGGDEAEEQLGAVVVERREADLVDQHEIRPQDVFDDPADGVVGKPAVERLDELGGGEVADAVAGVDGGVAEGDEQVATCRCRPDRRDRGSPSPRPTPGWPGSRRSPWSPTRRPTSNSSSVLVTGKAAVLSRSRALDASREAISASTRVRRNSSGAQRWVLARDQQLRGEACAWREAEPAQSGLEIGRAARRCRGAHDRSPMA